MVGKTRINLLLFGAQQPNSNTIKFDWHIGVSVQNDLITRDGEGEVGKGDCLFFSSRSATNVKGAKMFPLKGSRSFSSTLSQSLGKISFRLSYILSCIWLFESPQPASPKPHTLRKSWRQQGCQKPSESLPPDNNISAHNLGGVSRMLGKVGMGVGDELLGASVALKCLQSLLHPGQCLLESRVGSLRGLQLLLKILSCLFER